MPLQCAMPKPTIARGRYRHYKGRDYEVLGLALHSETREQLVVYRCLYGDFDLWVRPLAMFQELVSADERQVPRFARLDADGDSQ
jgi:hypothetical protein